MSSRRKRLSPQTLNDLLFLKANRRYWPNASIIDEVIQDPPNDIESCDEDDGNDV